MPHDSQPPGSWQNVCNISHLLPPIDSVRVEHLALERRLMRPRMRAMLFLPGEMIAALDNERRRYPNIPARNAIARELINEALSFRRASRPKSSGAGGEAFPIGKPFNPNSIAAMLEARHEE
jgi:hypothetical protein